MDERIKQGNVSILFNLVYNNFFNYVTSIWALYENKNESKMDCLE